MADPLRIAVVSTPRAGNTWVRHLLGTAYEVPHFARHAMAAEDWAALPPEVVLQIHWRRDPAFEAKLAGHGFRVVTVARHPLDVLVSVLHFCIYESESEHWLLGAGGSEAEIFAAMPRSRAFVEYAAARGRPSCWPSRPTGGAGRACSACGTRTACATPDGELRRLEAALGPVRCGSRAAAVEACSLARAAAHGRRTTTSGRARRACGGTCSRRPRPTKSRPPSRPF